MSPTPTIGKTWRGYWSPERVPVIALREVLTEHLAITGKPARLVLCARGREAQFLGVVVRQPDPSCEPVCSDGHIYFVLEEGKKP